MNDADTLGSMATGALIAREIERAQAGAPALGHAIDEPCANCGAIRGGPYCQQCGQAGHVHRNLGALVHDIAHGVFHFEGRIWNTLPLLVRRPGELTRRYVHGERAKFVSPIALFLFSVFLMFAFVSGLAGAGGGAGIDRYSAGAIAEERADGEKSLKALEARRAAAKDPAVAAKITARMADERADIERLRNVERFGWGTIEADKRSDKAGNGIDLGNSRLNAMIRHAAEKPELVLYKMKSYAYKYSWALIPISVPFIWLLFAFRRDVGLYDHAIFAIYSLSFMSLGVVALVLLARLGVPTALISLAALIVPPLHMYKQLKDAYALGRFGAGWRTIALLVTTVLTSLLFAAFIFYLGSD